MEESSIESREHSGSEKKNEAAPGHIQTIKACLPILSIIKGLYDACGMAMYGPAATSDLPELPQWAKNICEQLRLTIFKRVLELKPQGAEMDWRNFGRMMGICQRLAMYLKVGWSETDFKPHSDMSNTGLTSDANKPILVPPTELLEQVEGAFVESMDAALAQKAQPQAEYLSGLAEGYEMVVDAQGQFVGDRGRTTVYFELLSRWQEIEAMRQATPRKSCADLYERVASCLGDPRRERFDWFCGVCKHIGLGLGMEGRPRKTGKK